MPRTKNEPQYKLWKQPNGIYAIAWWDGSKTKRLSTGCKSASDANKYLAQFLAGNLSPVRPTVPTVQNIVQGYLDDKLYKVRGYHGMLYGAKAVMKHLGDLEPEHLTRSVITNYAKKRLQPETVVYGSDRTKIITRSAGTVIKEIGILKAALKWAETERWIDRAPTITTPVSAPQPRERWLSKKEAMRLVNNTVSFHTRMFVLLGLYTGARTSAILELTWNRVDLDNRIIDFGTGHGNKRRAIVPIADQLQQELLIALERALSDYVVEHGGKPVQSIKTGFQRSCERAGLADVTPHILRHTAATWMAIDGVSIQKIAQFLKMSEAVAERRYAKFHPDYLRNEVKSLSF